MADKRWDEFTPQEKADWFDDSVKNFQALAEKRKKEALRESSANKKGMKRHKKRRWWQF